LPIGQKYIEKTVLVVNYNKYRIIIN